jgi:chemosensory pili system protein ChpA (sensor histidine kinase/response regulator)
VGEGAFEVEHPVEDEVPVPELVLPPEFPAEPSLLPAARTSAQRSLAEAVPGLPSAADLDLAGWGLAANADRVVTPDDEIKVIGALRLEIPVFNAFLNDADEASRRLSMVLAEWADVPKLPVPAEAAVQAFALAQGADRVGHEALAALAHQLVRVLRACGAGPGPAAVAADPAWAAVNLTAATEEIRRVLHQFAAGFLTEPSASSVQRLAECLTDPLPSSALGHRAAGSGAQPLSDEGELQSLHDLASLQTELSSALDRLAQVRPSQAAAASDLAVADEHFDRAWSEATDRLAAAEGLVRSLLDRPRDPER